MLAKAKTVYKPSELQKGRQGSLKTDFILYFRFSHEKRASPIVRIDFIQWNLSTRGKG